jgi:hypothetical protein
MTTTITVAALPLDIGYHTLTTRYPVAVELELCQWHSNDTFMVLLFLQIH